MGYKGYSEYVLNSSISFNLQKSGRMNPLIYTFTYYSHIGQDLLIQIQPIDLSYNTKISRLFLLCTRESTFFVCWQIYLYCVKVCLSKHTNVRFFEYFTSVNIVRKQNFNNILNYQNKFPYQIQPFYKLNSRPF